MWEVIKMEGVGSLHGLVKYSTAEMGKTDARTGFQPFGADGTHGTACNERSEKGTIAYDSDQSFGSSKFSVCPL